MAFHHVNFHTLRGIPVFDQDEYDAIMRSCLPEVLRHHRVFCAVWEVMPTHLHLLIADFPDFRRGDIVGRVKGATAYAFFHAHPAVRDDLLGGHLWAKGYFSVLIATHEQFCRTIAYIRGNRERADLTPPAPLERFD
jgi:REP element-mobilizing transposase RayT